MAREVARGADLARTGRASLHHPHFAYFDLRLHISIFRLHVEDAEAVGVALPEDGLRSMLVPAKTRELFERLFSSWMLSTFTPAARVDHPDLAKAFAAVGLKPPNRKQIMGKHLDALHRSTLQEVTLDIQTQACVCVTMDGWKTRAAEKGAPLVTVNVLLPDGGAYFWKVC
jgi:hypothetical protein